MARRLQGEDLDEVRALPPECKALIPGHRRSYSFTEFVFAYGYKCCARLAGYWEDIYRYANPDTTHNEFRLFRRLLRDLSTCRDHHAIAVFKALSTSKPVPANSFAHYIEHLRARMINPEDTSFTDARGKSVVAYLEALRNCLNKLADAKALPRVELSLHGMYSEGGEVTTPCFATLAIDAGRLRLDADDDHKNALKFHTTNKQLLAALRASLVEVFGVAEERFRESSRMLSDPTIPTLNQIIRALRARAKLRGAQARAKRGLADLLRGTEEYIRAVALRAYIGLFHRPSLPVARFSLMRLLQEAGGHDQIAKLAEPCSDTLMACATIVQIDTGWEPSTVLNMDLNPFVGEIKKNSIIVRALVSKKGRAQGKVRNAAVAEVEPVYEEPDKDATLVVKQRRSVTSYHVIETYKAMTAEMRKGFPPRKAAKLWLTRGVRSLNEAVYGSFVRFLQRNQDHPDFGGLPLTRRSIKRTKYNVDAESTLGNIGLARARGDQSDPRLAFLYLSAPAVRAFFKSKIREYLQQMDAVLYSTVDDLARKLNIPKEELHKRKALGIENGLAELLVEPPIDQTQSQSIVERAKRLRPDDLGLRSLVIAGFAIEARWEEMAAKNPQRFLRSWVPWMALIQAMVQRLLKTRHRVKFRKTFSLVQKELALGQLALPIIW
ncbi:hypothetical protein GR197_11345 [Rhizobium phaseoli]|uniref:Uncharacterized protein n=1 Tax=Rhizobium phaseoli TaxID=396 RepID=A0A7K3UBT8_9HYPH|nr:hypothetical protein [Rhizobium phaseoli]NEJ71127.1 hypothetical protein [Rhizobium phaseoli]